MKDYVTLIISPYKVEVLMQLVSAELVAARAQSISYWYELIELLDYMRKVMPTPNN